jgi:cytochrome c2
LTKPSKVIKNVKLTVEAGFKEDDKRSSLKKFLNSQKEKLSQKKLIQFREDDVA